MGDDLYWNLAGCMGRATILSPLAFALYFCARRLPARGLTTPTPTEPTSAHVASYHCIYRYTLAALTAIHGLVPRYYPAW